jgi:AcrR family transcriptional regulator
MSLPAKVTATADGAEDARPRAGRPSLTNGELLDRALDLFLEHGYERTSIDAIVAAAGMAKRTVYARYGDKDTLFRAALRRAIDKWIVPVERLKAAETDDLEETLLNIGRILVANIMSPAGLRLLRLTNTVSVQMPEVAAHNVEQGTEPTLAYLTELLSKRVTFTNAHIFDAREAAMAFIHLVVGGPSSMAAWGVQSEPEAIERQTRNSVQLLLHGFVAQHPDADVLQDENRRLRQMLTDTLLENAALKEKSGA